MGCVPALRLLSVAFWLAAATIIDGAFRSPSSVLFLFFNLAICLPKSASSLTSVRLSVLSVCSTVLQLDPLAYFRPHSRSLPPPRPRPSP